MHLEAASIGPERTQYHPAVHPAWQRGPIQCQTLRGADWRDPFTGREGSRLLGTFRIRRLGQFDETGAGSFRGGWRVASLKKYAMELSPSGTGARGSKAS